MGHHGVGTNTGTMINGIAGCWHKDRQWNCMGLVQRVTQRSVEQYSNGRKTDTYTNGTE